MRTFFFFSSFCMTIWRPMRQLPASLHILNMYSLCQSHRTNSHWIQSVILRRINFNEKLIFVSYFYASWMYDVHCPMCLESRMWLLSYAFRIYFAINCCKFIVNCEFCPYYHALNFILKAKNNATIQSVSVLNRFCFFLLVLTFVDIFCCLQTNTTTQMKRNEMK